MATTVVLVDDHPLVRQGIRRALEKAADIEVIGEAGSGDEAFDLVSSLRPDVVFLDIELPDEDGIALLRRLGPVSQKTRFIMLSVFAQAYHVQSAMSAGAAGFLTKKVEPQQLVESVRDARQGRTPLCAEAATHIVSLMHERRDGGKGTRLTPRELEVWEVVCQGATNAEVARRLFISEYTVKFHVHNILKKLGVKRRTEAIYAQARTLGR